MSILDFIPNKIRRKISLLFFTIALLMALPPAFPAGEILSDTLLNLPTAMFLNAELGIDMLTALVLSFTLVPILLVYVGAFFAVTDTERTFNGQFTKIKNFFIKYINLIKKNPIHLIWLALSFYIFFRLLGFYQTRINIYVLS